MIGLIGPPQARVDGDRVALRFPDGLVWRLTVDEAIALTDGLTGAVDELAGVSGE